MRRILFVDDESRILAGLARMLHNLRSEWEMVFAEGGREALVCCESAPFDVIVSDARMPGMEGAELLREIMNRYPDTVRMVLSGQCSREAAIQCLGVAHQFLSKPCDPRILKETLHRTCSMRERFSDEMIRKAISRTLYLASRIAAYAELVEEVTSPVPRIDRLARIVTHDVAMSAKILQLVGSGFFGSPQQAIDAGQATRLLGADTLKALVDSQAAFQPADPVVYPEADIRFYNEHSVAVALVAKQLAETITDDRRQIGEAYLAGMLHGMGALALVGQASPPPTECDGMSADPSAMNRWNVIFALREISPKASGYLAALWGFSPTLVEAVGYYRVPHMCPNHSLGPLTTLHVAHAMAELADGIAPNGVAELDLDYLKSVGCEDRLPRWLEICRTYRPEGVLS